MAVVPAGVHLAIHFATKGDIRLLMNGQRVHVSSQGDAGSISAANRGDNTGLSHRMAIGYTQFIQRIADQLTSAYFLVHQLRITM